MKFTTETIGTVFGIVFQDHVVLEPYRQVVLKDKPAPLIKMPIWGRDDLIKDWEVFNLKPEEALAFARHLNKRVRVTITYELLEDEPAEAPTP